MKGSDSKLYLLTVPFHQLETILLKFVKLKNHWSHKSLELFTSGQKKGGGKFIAFFTVS